ncbi:MAG: HDIG domain-containing protein, partial [Syntrophomonadaceae bacterium]|nr:HDIG domain-containing protein [Syntrophomonadaceae bacterium]
MPDFLKNMVDGLKKGLNGTNSKLFIGAVLFFTLSFIIMIKGTSPGYMALKVDEVAPNNIQSNTTTIVYDEIQTAELRKQAAEGVQKVYNRDHAAIENSASFVNLFFEDMFTILAYPETERASALAGLFDGLAKEPEQRITSKADLVQYWQGQTIEEVQQVRDLLVGLVQGIMEDTIAEEKLLSVNEQAALQINYLNFPQPELDTMQYILVNATRPNLIFNQEATDEEIRKAVEAIPEVTKTVKAGEIIVREGERVTPEQISILEQMGYLRSNNFPYTIVGLGLFVLLIMWLGFKYMQRYYKDSETYERSILLMELVFLFILILIFFIFMVKISDQPRMNDLVRFIAPVAAGTMLITILLDYRLALFWCFLMSVFVGVLSDSNQLYYAIVSFVGGTIGVFKVHHISQTSDLAKAGLYVALGNVIAIIIVLMISGNLELTVIAVGVVIGAINGILSAVLMIGTLPFLETVFGITSMMKLLELSNPNHYILRRLLMEAPGTYHHSLMVGNLAEATAGAVGANAMLVRAGAYYHDIGKLRRPEYFIENQNNFGNPHENMAPVLSSLIVISHVRDGVEMAKEAKLPQSIIDFIEQHHGTSLVKFFYNKALQNQEEQMIISEEGFHYEGPKPKKKETALVMLADAVEASVRSLPEPSSEAIKKMVKSIVNDKLQDGQLSDSDLTFKDLDIIIESFCHVLEGI